MTASAPDISSAVTASSNEVMSPLTTSGMPIASLTARTAPQSALALVELATGAAVHRDHLHAGGFGAARQFGRVERTLVPAEPHLQRHRHLHRRDRRLDQRQGVVEIAHQRRAGLAAGDVARRTAHVDVDDFGAGGFRDAGAFRHPVVSQPASWTTCGPIPVASQRSRDIGRCLDQILAGGHFGDDKSGAECRGQTPERGVGNARHRRQKDPVGDRNIAYFQRLRRELAGPVTDSHCSDGRFIAAVGHHSAHKSWAVKLHAYTLDRFSAFVQVHCNKNCFSHSYRKSFCFARIRHDKGCAPAPHPLQP